MNIVAFIFLMTFLGISYAENNGTVQLTDTLITTKENISMHQVNLQSCRFKFPIRKGEYLSFNDPDVVFYKPTGLFNKEKSPYLVQAETFSGYDWHFKKTKKINEPWLGFMCESIDSFPWGDKFEELSNPDETSPAIAQLYESNIQHCPAFKVNGKWVLVKRNYPHNKNIVFKSLVGEGWDGFLLGIRGSKKVVSRVQFCLINGSNVLIGEGGSGSSNDSFTDILSAIQKIEFVSE